MPVVPPTPLELAILAVVGLVAGAVNTVAGAGSLLLLPALIFTGLPPDAANATNRIGIVFQTSAAVWGYRQAGLSLGRTELALTVAAMLGGAVGSFLATLLSADQTRIAIVICMGVMLVLSLVPRKKGTPEEEARRTLPEVTPGMLAGFFGIGVYGGFLQAGVGILALLFLSLVFRAGLVASNVVKSTATLGLTIVAIGMFAARGETLDLARGGVLALSSAIGGYAGAKATVRLGERVVRIGIVLAVSLSMIKLLWDM